MLRQIFLLLLIATVTSCSVESRINRWSYTDEWYYLEEERYQVYQTLTHRRYIIVVDTTKFILKRQYLKKDQHDSRRN